MTGRTCGECRFFVSWEERHKSRTGNYRVGYPRRYISGDGNPCYADWDADPNDEEGAFSAAPCPIKKEVMFSYEIACDKFEPRGGQENEEADV